MWNILLVSLLFFTTQAIILKPPVSHRLISTNHSSVGQCEERWFSQYIDHFSWSAPLGKDKFDQRYFICSEYWDGLGPIFFYTGNEADVTLYLNATGLMWENAPQYHALLIFAEHRYFGKSLPFSESNILHYMNYLSSEQALEDFATLIRFLRESLPAPENPIIAFGGSYGGMLASWLRIKYPSAVDGAIAASAPILSFLGLNPPYDSNSFANIETIDATPSCRKGVRLSWNIISSWAQSISGLGKLSQIFHLCKPLTTAEEAISKLYGWASNAIAFLAMGNFPYATSYITNGGCVLPPWPMKVGCGFFNNSVSEEQILGALRDFSGVFYNCTGKLRCYNLDISVNNETARDGLFWDYLWCTGIQQPFSQNGVTDMFWPAPYSLNASIQSCLSTWGITPRPFSPIINYGGNRLEGASNIVFSNGILDPWHGGGVIQSVSSTVVAILIEDAAHHLDLMFSNPNDPESVKKARNLELENINKWITEKKAKNRKHKVILK